MTRRTLIETRALDKTFGFAPVLRGVNLRVAGGRGLLVAGRNGAGKSTLIALLAGLQRPSAGAAMLFGADSRSLAPDLRRRVGILTHQSFLYPNLTARENLEFFGALYGSRDAGAVADAWLDRVGLAIAADERVRDFSRGMERRLSLARAMLATPEVLLMDDPFEALDAEGTALTVAVTAEAMARGCAVVMTAHQAVAPSGLTLELAELAHGRLLSRGDQLVAPPAEAAR
ncbi:MAG: ABC transporter ATP-binding protein [Candidatus Binataceae bacterium]